MRNLFRRAYAGETLRAQYGLARPPSRLFGQAKELAAE